MPNRLIEFSVDDIRQRGAQFTIAGRCCEDSIRIGDVFSKVFRYEAPKTLADYGARPILLPARDVSLSVVRIWTYGHEIDELSRGTTAEITLTGRGANQLEVGDALSASLAV